MLTRIVRMVFVPEFVPNFRSLFDEKSELIRMFPGCEKLELWVDDSHENIFYTHSHWLSASHLEAYRKSDLFREVWKQTKTGFADRPQAWSTRCVMSIDPSDVSN